MRRPNTEFSRKLRREQTDAEKKLWLSLRNRQLSGMKFRRQFAVGRYILDFYCPEVLLAVELDGGQHYEREIMLRDESRTKQLTQSGIKTLRFSDREALMHTGAVCEAIRLEVERRIPPHLNPLPRGERKISSGFLPRGERKISSGFLPRGER
jgi:very-short-patch-repair endonuclease